MINWNHQQQTYPQWNAGQASTTPAQQVLTNTSLGTVPPVIFPGDDDGDYFMTITNW